MNYHVRITPNEKNSGIEVMLDLEFNEVQTRFLVPYQQGVPITINGRTFDPSEIKRIAIARSSENSKILIDRISSERARKRITDYRPPSWEIIEEAEDITNQLVAGPPGQGFPLDAKDREESQPPTDTKRVFVVHGRNERAREAIFTFLRAIGLHPLEWSEVTQATGKPTPYIGDILNVAFSRAHAIVVLFTPDDEARLKEHLWEEKEHDYETALAGQARPNVLFEAGMAMGRNNERTVLVELGNLRPFSDISGLHVVRLDNNIQTWKELANRLETAGCPVNWDGTDWQEAGDFQAAIESVVRVQTESAEAIRLKSGIIKDSHLFGGSRRASQGSSQRRQPIHHQG